MAKAPSHEDWVRALADVEDRAVLACDPHVLTMAEFREALGGVHRVTANGKMQKLLAAGRVTRTRKLVRRTDGCYVQVPAYRFVASPPTPAKASRAKR